jgi:hypothetical protein
VRSGVGSGCASASESGRLRHGDGAHGRGGPPPKGVDVAFAPSGPASVKTRETSARECSQSRTLAYVAIASWGGIWWHGRVVECKR